jgi:DNA polymerase elongation subunit (family B)
MSYIWDDNDGMLKIPYEPYAYQIDSKGEYRTLTGLKVKKVKKWSDEAVKQGQIFEHDVPIATRVLIDNYFESDEPSKNHRILIFDIEVEKGLKYSKPKDALNRITSIAYHYNGKYVCLLLDEGGRIQEGSKQFKVNGTENYVDTIIKTYKSEFDLLKAFLSQWNTIKPTIVSSWNGDYFDVPYLYNRLVNVLGNQFAKQLSPIGIVTVDERGKDVKVKIAGIAQMDYLVLYKKFTYNEESSYKLEAISQKELGRGKYSYEGTLDDLYNNNPDGFVEYNVNDVELIVSMDKKLDLIEIARGICHKGHVPYDDFEFSSKYLEGAILTRCKRTGLVSTSNLEKTVEFEVNTNEVFIKDKHEYIRLDKYKGQLKDKLKIYEYNGSEYELLGVHYLKNQKKHKQNTVIVTANKAKGAFVKPPKPGLHEWVYSVDLQSLYPSLIMTCNISPETQMYFIEDWNNLHMVSKLLTDGFDGNLKQYEGFNYLPDDIILELTPIINDLFSERSPKVINLTKSEFIKLMNENNYTISSHGVIYHTKFKGIIPSILEEWFDERIKYKNLAKEHKSDNELYQLYDRKQLITKILLNSLYGVLLLPSFRYYDKKNGESVTISGQTVIKFSDILGTYYYQKRLNNPKQESPVIAGDTDSAYFSALPLLDLNKTDDEIVKDIEIISNKMTAFINQAVNWLSIHHLKSSNNRLKFMQEKIIRRAVWGQAKKRYALLTVDNEVSFKGFDLVRSSFPKIFRKKQTEILEYVVKNKGVSFINSEIRTFHNSEYKKTSIFDIMLPSSVKEMSKYAKVTKGTPIHVKSAQNYNKLLKLHNIEYLPPIDDGDKILYAYVRQNPFGFETMALKGQDEDPPELVEFMEKYIDKEKVFNTTFISKLDTIWEDLGWGKIQLQEPTDFF